MTVRSPTEKYGHIEITIDGVIEEHDSIKYSLEYIDNSIKEHIKNRC